MSKLIKIIIGVAVLLVIVFFIYKVATSQSDTNNQDSVTRVDYSAPNNTASSGEAASLLRTLKNLEKVELNGAIFSDPAFMQLSDFSREIEPIDKYRQNPFSPIGTNDVTMNQGNISTTTSIATPKNPSTIAPRVKR